ncbi:MAG: hypothetical protein H6917_08850 [Novosphingobium sp.]|nr:hypothetical protein [Novosphingobium sp.]MCP5402484.1 hypothetical protein [Novosphingobium sp.]
MAAATARARELVAAESPDEQTSAEGEAYVARVLTSQLAGGFLGHLLTQDGFARALPTHGGPNPDYLMLHAGVSHEGRYRITGRLNASERVGIGLYRFDEAGAIFEVGYVAFDSSNTGADGTFSLELSADAGGPGTLAITPEARVMLVRVLHLARGEPAARVMLDGPSPPPGLCLTMGSADGTLGFAANGLVKTIEQFLEWTRATSARPNSIGPAPPHLAEAVRAEPETTYFLGYFDLADGQWLEVLMPENLPGYWSLHAYNHWTEHLQVEGAHNRNAQRDDDGRVRVRIGPGLPEALSNRIDTLKIYRGILICRIIGAPGVASPVARLVQPNEEN